jgi:hypothetical protein
MAAKMGARATLRQVVVVGLDEVRDVQAQVLELLAQGSPGDAQQGGGPGLVAAGVLQDARQHEPIQLPLRLRVQVAGLRAEPLAEERLRVEAGPRGRHRRGGLAGRLWEFGEEMTSGAPTSRESFSRLDIGGERK